MFIIKAKCAICEEFYEVRNKHYRIRQTKTKKTKLTRIDDISFFLVKQTSIKLVMLIVQISKIYLSFNNVERNEHFTFQNDFQKWIFLVLISSRFAESASLKSTSSRSKSIKSKSAFSKSTSFASNFCLLVVALVVVFVVVFVVISIAIAFVQHFINSSVYSNWQTMMTQMRKQSRQIIILINVVSQFILIAKLKRKLIIMFSTSENF